MAVTQDALTLRSKGQNPGHTIMKTVTITWPLWPCAATAGVGLLVV